MNTTLGICPNCKVITNIQLVKYKAYFQCNCGYYNSVDIKECIHLFQTNNLSKVKTKNKEFTDFTYSPKKMSSSGAFFDLEKLDNISMDILSMGMSSDYYEAILEGANMVRIGSALFGNRIYK